MNTLLMGLIAVPANAQLAPSPFDGAKLLPLTPGAWSYAVTATGIEARYGQSLVVRCNRMNRTVAIMRHGGAPAPLNIVTSSASRTLPASGTIGAQDRLLDAIAFSRGRFLVTGGIGPNLIIPAWPEAARVVEDCRG